MQKNTITKSGLFLFDLIIVLFNVFPQPKWNEALLEMFRIDYVGTSPYITCSPSLHHHRLSSRDKFLILSSDGLYEYFSNEEAIFEVDSFISAFPEGDPAQHLIQEVLLRAAKKYGNTKNKTQTHLRFETQSLIKLTCKFFFV